MGEEIAVKNDRISNFQGLVTLTLTLDRVVQHTSCITHRRLPTYQISLKSKKLFVDGRTDIFLPMLLGRRKGVDLKIRALVHLYLSTARFICLT